MVDCTRAQTLTEVFLERVDLSPGASAYRFYDGAHGQWVTITWKAMGQRVAQCAAALRNEALEEKARIGIMLPNGIDWITVEQAAMSCGLIVVPLYFNDRPNNVRHIIEDAGIQCLFMHHSLCDEMSVLNDTFAKLQRLVIMDGPADECRGNQRTYRAWKKDIDASAELDNAAVDPEDVVSIVYTSGTAGRPKGVMLTHKNILWNTRVSLRASACDDRDCFLSLLPLSHMLERTAGYYIPMVIGAEVAFARSPLTYADDLRETHPSVLVVVPRVLERIREKVEAGLVSAGPVKRWLFKHCIKEGWQGFQKKAVDRTYGFLSRIIVRKFSERLGGRVRLIICGGAPLNESVSRMFIGLGLDIIQGYGLTETSPVVSVNRLDANRPDTVGLPLDEVEVRVSEHQELQTRSPGVMKGYWKNKEATQAAIDEEGWFKTGDQAVIEDGFIRITGRLKDIIVLSTGEKISPTDVEMTLLEDDCIDQVIVTGNGCPTLTAIIVPNMDAFSKKEAACSKEKTEAMFLQKIHHRMQKFPGYVKVTQVIIAREPWTQENDCLTPTLKIKRSAVEAQYL